MIANIALTEQVDTFVVGAWGCGVFQQSPTIVAQYFKEEARHMCLGTPLHLVFAILPPKNKHDINLREFKNVIEKEK